jgi:hypothetical protein
MPVLHGFLSVAGLGTIDSIIISQAAIAGAFAPPVWKVHSY